jgi:hypothetical protein
MPKTSYRYYLEHLKTRRDEAFVRCSDELGFARERQAQRAAYKHACRCGCVITRVVRAPDRYPSPDNGYVDNVVVFVAAWHPGARRVLCQEVWRPVIIAKNRLCNGFQNSENFSKADPLSNSAIAMPTKRGIFRNQ